jgi:hypothetical protein
VSNSVISGTDVRLHGGNSVIQLHGYLARVVPDGAWLRSLDRTRGESSAVNGAGGRIAALGAARNILRVRGGGRGGAHITATSDDGGSSGSSGGQRIRTMGKHDVKAGHTSALYGISVAIAYAATSVAITFANKIVLSSYDFKFEMTLILAQLVLGTLVINLLFAFGVCERPPLKIDTLRKSVPLAGWFLVYVVSGLGSLRSLTMPTWSALRRLTALFILVFDFGFDGKVAPLRIWLSVLMMLLGGVVAAAGDFDGSLRGHVHVAINCASSALYLRAINALRSSAGVSEVGALYLTNLLCFTPVVSIIYLTNEGSKVVAFPEWGQTGFLIALFGSSALAGARLCSERARTHASKRAGVPACLPVCLPACPPCLIIFSTKCSGSGLCLGGNSRSLLVPYAKALSPKSQARHPSPLAPRPSPRSSQLPRLPIGGRQLASHDVHHRSGQKRRWIPRRLPPPSPFSGGRRRPSAGHAKP